MVPLTSKHDEELLFNTPLKDRTPHMKFNGNRIYTRFPTVPLSDLKDIRKKHGVSVNDIIMAALAGALRRYGADVLGDAKLKDEAPGGFRSSCVMMMALPRPVDDDDRTTALVNKMLFMSCRLPIDEPTPLGRLDRVTQTCNDLKNMAYIAGVNRTTQLVVGVLPQSATAKAVSELFSKHSLLVSSTPAMTVPTSFPEMGGKTISEMHMVFPNIIPQLSVISYNGSIAANLVADPQLFPEPEKLGELWGSEFKVLQKA